MLSHDTKQSAEESKMDSTSGSTNTVNGYSFVENIQQTRNTGEIVRVVGPVLDDTEGLTAIDTLPFSSNTRNFDIGGGQFDTASKHLKHFYDVDNYVYDLHNRTPEHNTRVLSEVENKPVDTVTSISVLNVILDPKERREHLQLAYKSLKKGGMAFFKVYRGNGSGIADRSQSNQIANCYLKEIQAIFGNGYIPRDDIGNTIFARKR